MTIEAEAESIVDDIIAIMMTQDYDAARVILSSLVIQLVTGDDFESDHDATFCLQ